MSRAPVQLTDGLPTSQRHWAMVALMLGTVMAVLDGSIANVALPTIARDLSVDAADSIWVVNAYQLSILLLLLPFASLGDIYGYKRVYVLGLVVFLVGCVCCALAPTLPLLVAARVAEGIGAAGIMSVNGALVRLIYPRVQLGRAIGMIALVVSATSASGPTIASAILSVASWSWLFVLNIPLGLITLWLTLGRVPATPRLPHRFDACGALLCMATIGLLIAGVDGLGHGSPPWLIAAELAAALIFGLILVRWENKVPLPILAVDLFRRPIFSLSVATSICSFTAASLGLISLPFYFVEVLGRSQVEAGLLMTPWPVLSAITAPIAGRLADRYPVQILGCVGLASLCVGLTSLALLPPDPQAWNIAWRMALCGLGFALFQSPNNRVLMSSAPRERSGAASGVLSTARLMGQTIGAALAALSFHIAAGAEGATIAICVGAGAAAAAFTISALRKSGETAG